MAQRAHSLHSGLVLRILGRAEEIAGPRRTGLVSPPGGCDPLPDVPLKLELPGDCLLCHQTALVSDMAFSINLLKRFAATGAVQYSFCPHPGRQSCPFR